MNAIGDLHVWHYHSATLGALQAFGREYIANPDLVERIRLNAPLNQQRPESYYGSSHVGYTDYPSLTKEQVESSTPAVKEGAYKPHEQSSSAEAIFCTIVRGL
jgi:hypothetical protein